MSHVSLRCTSCKTSHQADMASIRCRECGSPLGVVYSDLEALPSIGHSPESAKLRIPTPLHDPNSSVSLGEGHTPCAQLNSLGELLGLKRLYAKLEFLNPTGSFKDRGTVVMMSVAKEHGVTEIVEDSSGNAGASIAAYAARAGIRAHIFVPAGTPSPKIGQIKVHGAEIHSTEDSRDAATDAATAYSKERRLVYASHNLSPYFIEGTKTFAYELVDVLGMNAPDHVVMPVGNGSLLIGTWKGFTELHGDGYVAEIPRLHCVQARAVMPIVAAYNGIQWGPEHGPSTVAGGISVGSPPRKQQVLDILRATGGTALAVDDSEILLWQKRLAEQEGIYAEPTSAAALAGLHRLVELDKIGDSDSVLVPITGSGLKDTPPV